MIVEKPCWECNGVTYKSQAEAQAAEAEQKAYLVLRDLRNQTAEYIQEKLRTSLNFQRVSLYREAEEKDSATVAARQGSLCLDIVVKASWVSVSLGLMGLVFYKHVLALKTGIQDDVGILVEEWLLQLLGLTAKTLGFEAPHE